MHLWEKLNRQRLLEIADEMQNNNVKDDKRVKIFEIFKAKYLLVYLGGEATLYFDFGCFVSRNANLHKNSWYSDYIEVRH